MAKTEVGRKEGWNFEVERGREAGSVGNFETAEYLAIKYDDWVLSENPPCTQQLKPVPVPENEPGSGK